MKQQKKEKKEEIIDLTDFSGMNRTNAVRDPKPRSRLDLETGDGLGFESVQEVKGYDGRQDRQKPEPSDPEPQADERLEAEGAQIVNSTTYFPASKQTLTGRSQTVEERAEERERTRKALLD